jgi:hypothetical protein
MLYRLTLWLAAPLLVAADVASLYPIYTPETVITIPEFGGLWADFRIHPNGSNGYVVVMEGEQISKVHLARIGGDTFADVSVKFMDAAMPLHMVARLRFEAD